MKRWTVAALTAPAALLFATSYLCAGGKVLSLWLPAALLGLVAIVTAVAAYARWMVVGHAESTAKQIRKGRR